MAGQHSKFRGNHCVGRFFFCLCPDLGIYFSASILRIAQADRLQIASSFRTFGVSPATKSLIVVKIATDPTVTNSSVSQHLSGAIKGTTIGFDDNNISKFTDMSKVKKTYKINDGKNIVQPRNNKGNPIVGNSKGEEQSKGAQELEVIVLGMMALRGQT